MHKLTGEGEKRRIQRREKSLDGMACEEIRQNDKKKTIQKQKNETEGFSG